MEDADRLVGSVLFLLITYVTYPEWPHRQGGSSYAEC